MVQNLENQLHAGIALEPNHILVVDDEALIRETVGLALRKTGIALRWRLTADWRSIC